MKPENTEEPRGRLQEMAQVDVMETPHQTAAYQEEEKENKTLMSPAVIEILDSTNECEEEGRSEVPQMEEKAFVARLHAFMKDRGSPIERIPHLGFKQINLWMIYKAVEKLGGYDSVTARRLWKKVYDELGGSPGSTSAATCTRRHYERLVLPFERHVKGEEDKPLPQSKPRKPYKRNLDAKMNKVEGKRKRPQSERELDTESPEAPCQSEAAMHPHSALWPATQECPQTSHVGPDLCLCASVYACPHHLQVPAAGAWTPHVLASAGEVISPLEKKKRMAQASLNLPASPQGEEKERPSVIHCSQSPGWAPPGRNCNSSDGSPQPQSSSSSRSPSPCSVSSEDAPAGNDNKAAASSSEASGCPGSAKSSSGGGEDASQSCSRVSKDPSLPKKETPPASSLTPDSLKAQAKHFPHPFYTSYAVKSDWAPTSTSSFTKVVPKSGPLPRPAPVWPGYKIHQSRAMHHDDSHACAKKAKGGLQWLYHTEKKDKSRTMLQKVPPTVQSLSHAAPAVTVPLSCVLSGYDKSGRDSRHQPPPHPAYYPSRMRIPQPQQLYRHFPVSPAHSAIYPYPYSIPLLTPHTGYILPAMNPIYPHKL